MLSLQLPPMVKLVVKMSLSIAEARNEVLQEAEGDWVWFIDDDHTFAPDLMMRLLQRNVDIVQPLVLTRYAPFAAVHMTKSPTPIAGKPYGRFALTPEDKGGLKEASVVGCAGMLVRRRVWESLDYPYFVNGYAADSIAEDVLFCERAREAGFKAYVDLDNHMGHLNIGEVWPERRDDGTWCTRLVFGQQEIELPTAAPKFRVNHETGEVTPYDGRMDEGESGREPSTDAESL